MNVSKCFGVVVVALAMVPSIWAQPNEQDAIAALNSMASDREGAACAKTSALIDRSNAIAGYNSLIARYNAVYGCMPPMVQMAVDGFLSDYATKIGDGDDDLEYHDIHYGDGQTAETAAAGEYVLEHWAACITYANAAELLYVSAWDDADAAAQDYEGASSALASAETIVAMYE